MNRFLTTFVLSFALFAFAFSTLAPIAYAQPVVLCFNDIDCPDGTTCKQKGTQEGGRGICRDPSWTPSPSPSNAVLSNPLEADSLEDLLLAFVRGIVRIAVIALLVFFVYAGFQFVAAQGNEEKLRSARTALMWTAIGAAILLGAEVIMGIIESTASALAP